jgi:hypothetical protein
MFPDCSLVPAEWVPSTHCLLLGVKVLATPDGSRRSACNSFRAPVEKCLSPVSLFKLEKKSRVLTPSLGELRI